MRCIERGSIVSTFVEGHIIVVFKVGGCEMRGGIERGSPVCE